jgi:hypothetical protein
MPDNWEVNQGLDPEKGGDATDDLDSDGYGNLEEYLHWLATRPKGVGR